MNEIQIYLKTSGSIAELYKDFNLYVGSYQNVLLSVYVPTSLLYQNEQGTYVNSVKTGAITTAPNGTQVTTDGYGMDYVNTVTVDNVEYAVYGQKLPNTFVTYAGTQTVVVNVVAIDNTNPDSPVILQIVTSQTAPLVVQQSAYLGQEPAIPPEEVDVINGRLSTLEQSVDSLEENKLDKQSGVIAYRQVYGVQNGTQALYSVNDGPVSSPPYGSAIVMSTSTGNVFAATPTESSHAANKSYVDAADENLSNKIETLRQDIDSKSHFRGYLTTAEIQSLPNPDNGDYAWSSDTLTVWSYNGSQWVNTGNPVPDQTVPKGETTPLPDAESGSAGTATSYAAIDHVHPKSDIYASAEEFSGLNTDYQAFKTNQTTINSSVSNTLQQLAADIVTSEQETGAFIHGENTLKDVTASVEVQSENLILFPYQNPDGDSGSMSNGVTYSVSEDGGILFNGTASEDSNTGYFILAYEGADNKLPIGIYAFSCNTIPENFRVVLSRYFADGINIQSTLSLTSGFEKIIDYTPEVTHYEIFCAIDPGCTINQNVYIKLQSGEAATSYTKPLIAGTPVNITACGKNLIPFPYKSLGGAGYTETKNGVTLTVQSDGGIRLKGTSTLNDITYFQVSVGVDYGENNLTPSSPTNGRLVISDNKVYYDGNNKTIFLQVDNNETVDYVSYPQIEYGTVATLFELWESQNYSSQVGQTADVTQYDKVTNIFATTAGGAVSTQFLLSTKYELNDKVNLLVGTLATRPTTTQAYGIIYIATDQTGANRVTYLPPNTDGSVSGNWISFNS